jgi:hypothetical protein
MRSIDLWRWYINKIIKVLDIIHRPFFYLKHAMDNVRISQETLRLCYESNGLMRSMDSWRRYINITTTVLDIILCPVFYLKHDVSNTELSLRNVLFIV